MSVWKNVILDYYSRLLAMDWFSNAINAINNLTSKFQPLLIVAAILCLLLAGALFMMGDDMKRSAKGWILGILIGVFIISSCTALINTYAATIKF
ncbi:hypothetical protein A0T38_14095 [Listeria monocytogenes]|uniref:TrbC/VirB2 family protein n=1 Tax=Listeria TaxID=1637 RepID=UPI00083D4D37|nr:MULTISPECIES: TrbC/VirB2 family protein [Listeria]EAE3728317.1 hypothetical protein [Listeria monocytogenes serotype 1/2b]EAC5124619.1 hypothetical protein [Listeria monocytogenes]EAC5601023.1 hypothetical protein [Listeria monocytogenes]EAC5777295.1 hypothetical protein [Listeria monocytogenes]EAC7705703.1 hypothetical protein [Listeria monocytogenes]